jgi:RNA polymerase sigma-70 factor (ECF subfamily)
MVSMGTDRVARWGGVTSRDQVERARAGDREAFADLAAAALPAMFATACLIVRNPAIAEDATQDALVNAWRYLPTLRDPSRYEAWLYRLLINACRTHRRRQAGRELVEIAMPDDDRFGHEPDLSIVDRDLLERGFHRLGVEERAILVLRFYGERSVPEIAAILDLPLGTAKSRLHRATGSLRAAVDAESRGVAHPLESRP